MKTYKILILLITATALIFLNSCDSEKKAQDELARELENEYTNSQKVTNEISKTPQGKIYLDLKKADDQLDDQKPNNTEEKLNEYYDKVSDIDGEISGLDDKIEEALGKDNKIFSDIAKLYIEKAQLAEKYGYDITKLKKLADELLAKSAQ
jgi:hypothetical protein